MKIEEVIPLGIWDLSGNWYPNLGLKKTEEEQREWNRRGGHMNQKKKGGKGCGK